MEQEEDQTQRIRINEDELDRKRNFPIVWWIEYYESAVL